MPKDSYKQKIRDAWLKQPDLAPWIARDVRDPEKAYCKYCKCSVNSKIYHLRSHMETKKHLQNAQPFGQVNKLNFKPALPKPNCRQEAGLVMFLAQHAAINPVGHLSALCATHFSATEIKLNRTKCTSIMKNVLAVHFIDDLRKDIGEEKYSLLIDESTDISISKLLGVAIVYYSQKRMHSTSTFLRLIAIESGDAQTITNSLLRELDLMKLPIQNLIGIGTDNANVMVGKKTSVSVELRKSVPSLVTVRCVCHSVQLAVNAACKDCLPQSLEFIVSETIAWFCKSAKRQIAYRKLYQAINNDEAPLKIPRVCDTRWLSIKHAVRRILNQWIELKLHFNTAALTEKCHKASILSDLFTDGNYLYLLFLKPILEDMQRINKNFQSSKSNPTKLLGDLILAINSLKSKIIPPEVVVDIFCESIEPVMSRDLYLGYEFESHLRSIREKIDQATENTIRQHCTNFVLELINQLKQRLPDNFEILKNIEIFSVGNVLQAKKEPIVGILEFFKIPGSDIEKIVSQYNTINLMQWQAIDETVAFWAEVINFKDSAGNTAFLELAAFALRILSLPWSKAEVERVFSQVNLVKTKLRSKMRIDTLNAILSIRFGLRRQGACCHNYELPDKYMQMIGTREVYESNDTDEENVDEVVSSLANNEMLL